MYNLLLTKAVGVRLVHEYKDICPKARFELNSKSNVFTTAPQFVLVPHLKRVLESC